jgi:hypothetical protein
MTNYIKAWKKIRESGYSNLFSWRIPVQANGRLTGPPIRLFINIKMTKSKLPKI